MYWLKRLLRRSIPRKLQSCTASKCGHHTSFVGTIHVFGHSATMAMPMNVEGATDYCLDCIEKMSIRCAWCEDPIVVGDPITLYTPKSEKDIERGFDAMQKRGQIEFPFVIEEGLGFPLPDLAVVYQQKPLQVVGCLGWDCADTGADRAGFWMPGENGKGMVRRVRTAFEEILAGRPFVITGDLSDPSQATDLEDARSLPTVRVTDN